MVCGVVWCGVVRYGVMQASQPPTPPPIQHSTGLTQNLHVTQSDIAHPIVPDCLDASCCKCNFRRHFDMEVAVSWRPLYSLATV